MIDQAPRADYRYGLFFLLAVTVASGLISESTLLALRASGLRDSLPPLIVVALPGFLGGALFPYLLIRIVYRSTLREFGVRWVDPDLPAGRWLAGSVLLTLVAWFGFWGLLCGTIEVIGTANPQQFPFTLAEFHARNPLHSMLHGGYHPGKLAYLAHLGLLIGFAEELFGRGLLQNALDRRFTREFGRGRFTVRSSTLLATLLFALWHTTWLVDKPTAVLASFASFASSMTIVLLPSFLLCLVYEKTRSMLAVIVLHNVIDGGKFAIWFLWSLILPG